MDVNLSYLLELGYSADDIDKLSRGWNNGILEYLSCNSITILENMKYLKEDFNKAFLFKLTIFYADAFSLSPEIFSECISLLKEAFLNDWVDIVKNQFYGYEEINGINYIPFFKAIALSGRNNFSSVKKALDVLHNPQNYVFGFMVLLSQIGINIDGLDVPEDSILDLEVGKYELIFNTKMLLEEGLSTDIIIEMLWHCPYFMILSKLEVKKKLIEVFGDDYILEMERQYNEDILADCLIEKLW